MTRSNLAGAGMLAATSFSARLVWEAKKGSTTALFIALVSVILLLLVLSGLAPLIKSMAVDFKKESERKRDSKFHQYQIANPMIQDYEVEQLLRDLPTAKSEDQIAMRKKLAVWREGKRLEAAEKLECMFTDPETWGGQWTPERQNLASQTIAPETTKKGMANLKWLAAMEGKSTDDIADFQPAYRKAYSQKLFGKPDMSEDEFYGAIQAKYQAERATR